MGERLRELRGIINSIFDIFDVILFRLGLLLFAGIGIYTLLKHLYAAWRLQQLLPSGLPGDLGRGARGVGLVRAQQNREACLNASEISHLDMALAKRGMKPCSGICRMKRG